MTFPTKPTKGELHLWLLEHQKENHHQLKRDLLSTSELTRLENYHFKDDQNRYAFTQSGKRQILGRYLSTPPDKLLLDHNTKGKPLVQGLEISISHTKGLSVLAVTTSPPIGVDIEKISPQENLPTLARRIMSDSEWAIYHSLPESKKLTAFYQLWTAKEAYLKNLGIGFEIEPSSVVSDFPKLTSAKAKNHPSRFLFDYPLKDNICLKVASELPIENLQFFSYQKFKRDQ